MESSASLAPALGTTNLKVVILGDPNVGKTCLIQRFVYGTFSDGTLNTIGIDFFRHILHLEDGRSVRMNLWDTAGQERFRSMVPSYIRDAAVVIVVYDITFRQSFESARQWLCDARNGALPGAVLALAGNKTDEADARLVSSGEGQELADEEHMLFAETSAKSGKNVDHMFRQITAKLPMLIGEFGSTSAHRSAVPSCDSKLKLDHVSHKHSKKSCC